MLLYPDIQKAAQDQIDRIVGNGRLPEFTDRASLPFVTAIMHELFRCVAQPHRHTVLLKLLQVASGVSLRFVLTTAT